ncbi:uncharacterized protein C5L36_0D02930 [Pichia kudriavzevii]|uniref:LIM zinc-binding domain-containing protein n=1 Tax=Pichia kudriavzevii TaxID=4909 RepID=A0A2U9R847_PICKU|nr:uncharacterized protein C5L36_0D02930 [Pichia kudriavzevii]AWU77552.1 hypothetical protein C5L36_0D02930 [Pichia kudriavzevii]
MSYSASDQKLELNSLPDFLKTKSPQVKFHSAFPPLTTKVRVRGVMERAGFDVYKPPHNTRSVSVPLNSLNAPKGYRVSGNDNVSTNSLPRPPKMRNFTTAPLNTSTPDLLKNHSPTNSKSPVHYAREKLKIESQSSTGSFTTMPQIPDIAPPSLDMNLGNISNETIVQPLVVHDMVGEFVPSNHNQNQEQQQQQQQHIIQSQWQKQSEPIIEIPPRRSLPKIAGPRPYHSEPDSDSDAADELEPQPTELETPQLEVTNISSITDSENSSIAHKSTDSQDSLGGLANLRDSFKHDSLESKFQNYHPLPNDAHIKRISTLHTEDMKIYNLESLDDEPEYEQEYKHDSKSGANEMSIIQEGEIEDSRIETTKIPALVINDNDEDQDTYDETIPFENAVDYQQLSAFHNTDDEITNNYEQSSQTESVNPFAKVEEIESGGEDYEDYEDEHEPGLNLKTADFETPHNSSDINGITFGLNSLDIQVPPRHFKTPSPSALFSDVNDYQNDVRSTTTSPEDTHYDKITHDITQVPQHDELQHRHAIEVTNDSKQTQDLTSTSQFEEAELYYPPGEGPCRKCGHNILESEKKIWSKDHQLSGQWHRKCFGCYKCGAKFSKGSSCYVFNNQPYCEEHFHELNGSLCQICNKGVEGECLQNDINEAFHIDCLKCVICGLNVQGDYFLFRGEVMCEADANELMYQIEEAEKEEQMSKMIKRRTRILYL